jgi:hypothetical protein
VDICPDTVTQITAPIALGTLAAVLHILTKVPALPGPGHPVTHRTSHFRHINEATNLTSSSWSSPSTSDWSTSWFDYPWTSPSTSWGWPGASSSTSPSYSKPKTPVTSSNEGIHLYQLFRRWRQRRGRGWRQGRKRWKGGWWYEY